MRISLCAAALGPSVEDTVELPVDNPIAFTRPFLYSRTINDNPSPVPVID
ncbi:MAG TPA: hypothetical protein VF723_13735 [Pyrinomonadaceae bacterium]